MQALYKLISCYTWSMYMCVQVWYFICDDYRVTARHLLNEFKLGAATTEPGVRSDRGAIRADIINRKVLLITGYLFYSTAGVVHKKLNSSSNDTHDIS